MRVTPIPYPIKPEPPHAGVTALHAGLVYWMGIHVAKAGGFWPPNAVAARSRQRLVIPLPSGPA